MKTYLWCEDTRSGFEFWKYLMQVKSQECIVEGKNGISGLRRDVARISNSTDRYYLVVDYAIDNPDVLREVNAITRAVRGKPNITLVKIPCFEYILLSFALLDKWVFAEQDDLREKRKPLLKIKNEIVKMIEEGTDSPDSDGSSAANDYLNENSYNIEQALSRLLYEITCNTGFETNKSKLGECFYINCCDWTRRADDDICGLDESRISAYEKTELIIKNSVLSSISELEGLLHD